MTRVLTIVLALAGLADAFYFTLAYYGRVRKARWVPEILCAREGSNCVTVVQTPFARVFGVPNSLLGIIYYLLIIAWAVYAWKPLVEWNGISFPMRAMVAGYLSFVGAATVTLGFYLVYALRWKLKVNCLLCYTAHAINIALFIILIVAAR